MTDLVFPNRQAYASYIKQLGRSLVIVKAHAKWCGPCRRTDPLVRDLFSKLRGGPKHLILLDVDENSDVSTYLRIRGIPHMMSYVNGEPMDVLSSGDPEQIKAFFAKVQARLTAL